MADAKARVEITAEDRASSVIRNLRNTLSGFDSGINSLVGAFAKFGALGGLFGGAGALVGLRDAVSALDDLADAAPGLGLAAEQLSAFQISARAAGVDSEQFGSALTILNKKLTDAASGGKDSIAIFKAIGVNIRDSGGNLRSTADVLGDVADRFATYADGAAKSALATELFGRSGAKLITFLSQGKEGLAQFGGASREAIKEAAALQGEIDKLAASWEKLWLRIAGGFARAVLTDNLRVNTEEQIEALKEQIAQAEQAIGQRNTSLLDRLIYGTNEERQAAAINRLALLRAQIEGLKSAADDIKPITAAPIVESPDARREREEREREEAKAKAKRAEAFKKYQEELQRNAEAAAKAEQAYIDLENAVSDVAWDKYKDGLKRYNDEVQSLDDELFQLSGRLEETRKIALTLRLEDILRKDPKAYTPEELQRLVKGIGGIKDEIKQADDTAERFATVFTSSLGRLIDAGGDMRDVFKALAEDIAKLILQITILEPLAKSIRDLFKGGGSGGNIFSDIFGAVIGASAGGAVKAQGAGSMVVQITNNVGATYGDAALVKALDDSSKATVARIVDLQQRGRLGFAG